MDLECFSTTKHEEKRHNAVACNCIYQVTIYYITPIAHKFAIVGLLFLLRCEQRQLIFSVIKLLNDWVF